MQVQKASDDTLWGRLALGIKRNPLVVAASVQREHLRPHLAQNLQRRDCVEAYSSALEDYHAAG